jgi:hypothetical protein
MAQVSFPRVTATCVVPGSIIGASGNVSARVNSTGNYVFVTDLSGNNGTVSIDGDGYGSRGGLSMRLDAPALHRAGSAARTCASALRAPMQKAALRTIGARLDQLARARG